MAKKILTTPIQQSDLAGIKPGDMIYLTGHITTCRDMGHRRVVEEGKTLPVDVKDGAILHAGPIIRTISDNEFEVVSVGPTTSMRMEKYEYEFVKKTGVRLIVVKGCLLYTSVTVGDAIVQVLDGEAHIVVGDTEHNVKAGETLIMPSEVPHSLDARESFKMLLTVVK